MSPRREIIGPDSAMRSMDPAARDAEWGMEAGLRPKSLADFVGQEELKERLAIVLEAAKRRGQPVDHLLFAGPPGLGKTTLAGIVAGEMGAGFRITSGPALVRTGDIAAILTDLQPGDVLFIDEIHRLGRAVEEVLYPAMEDFEIDIVIGKGPTARSLRLELPRFTLVGATTRTGLVTGPLRDRFGVVARLDHYQPAELVAILERSARLLGLELTKAGAEEIAGRSRGRLASPSGYSGECGTMSRYGDRVSPRWKRPVRASTDSVSTRSGSITSTGPSSRSCACASLGARSGSRRSRSASARRPRRWRTCTSLSSSRLGSWSGPRGRVATGAAYAHLGLDVPTALVPLGRGPSLFDEAATEEAEEEDAG